MHRQVSSGKGRLTAALDKHFLACAAAAAGGGVMAPAPEAHGDIQYSGLLDIDIDPESLEGLYINVDALSASTSNAGDWDLNFFNQQPFGGRSAVLATSDARPANVVGVIGTAGGYSYAYVSRLGAGVTVGPGSDLVSPPSATYPYSILAYQDAYGNNEGFPEWSGGVTDGFVGFRFTAPDGEAHFGWARLNMADADEDYAMTLRDFAFDDQPGVAIQTGAIPEPAAALALAVLALGATGIRPPRKH